VPPVNIDPRTRFGPVARSSRIGPPGQRRRRPTPRVRRLRPLVGGLGSWAICRPPRPDRRAVNSRPSAPPRHYLDRWGDCVTRPLGEVAGHALGRRGTASSPPTPPPGATRGLDDVRRSLRAVLLGFRLPPLERRPRRLGDQRALTGASCRWDTRVESTRLTWSYPARWQRFLTGYSMASERG